MKRSWRSSAPSTTPSFFLFHHCHYHCPQYRSRHLNRGATHYLAPKAVQSSFRRSVLSSFPGSSSGSAISIPVSSFSGRSGGHDDDFDEEYVEKLADEQQREKAPLSKLFSSSYQMPPPTAATPRTSTYSPTFKQERKKGSSSSFANLDIPVSDSIDPIVEARVSRMTMDDIIAEELLDTAKKLLYTKTELAKAITQEKVEIQAERKYHRRKRAAAAAKAAANKPQNLSTSLVFKSADENVAVLELNDENEPLFANNPESQRRQTLIEWNQIHASIKDKTLHLEDAADNHQIEQFHKTEQARIKQKQRLLHAATVEIPIEQLTAEEVAARNLEFSDSAEKQRESEREEALNAARLRENLIHSFRQEFGEREGDDYELEEEEHLFEDQKVEDEQTQVIDTSTVQLRPRRVSRDGRAYGNGLRKSSRAQVWIKQGNGTFKVNHEIHAQYFDRFSHRNCFLRPFIVADRLGKYDVNSFVKGGGKTGQSGAIQLGISRALANAEPLLRRKLKDAGLLTVDNRKVERKKPGQPKARKKHAFVKR